MLTKSQKKRAQKKRRRKRIQRIEYFKRYKPLIYNKDLRIIFEGENSKYLGIL